VKLRGQKSRTADLFASTTTPRPKAAVLAPLPREQIARPASQKLWYAAVFPQLTELIPSAWQRLCLQAQAFTSFVSIEPPNALLLEIKGSLKLFGSLKSLHEDIDACWGGLALQAQSATAPSTLAALWMARAGHSIHIEDLDALPSHLAKLPIGCTAWDIEPLQRLRAMGVTRVGELLRLPRAGLTRRLSSAMVRDLDIALARQAAPRRAFVAREHFKERCDFETEIEHVAYLEKALEPLIGRCAQFLRGRQAGVQALQLRLMHRHEAATRVRLGLASITSERRRLSDVIGQKLNRLKLKAPVRSMELISGCLRGLPATSLDVFAGLMGTGSKDTAPQLVERLRARLGEQAVYGVDLIAEHRPEAAWRRVSALRLSGVSRIEQPVNPTLPRPVWLLQEPLAVAKPLILKGPERIESGWWDGKGVARDYYIAHSQGARLWVFQERQSKHWYLHGVFA
jgi:protein ImuB